MKDSEVKVIAEAMVKAAEKSGEKIAKGMVKSAETTAKSITESAEKTANAIIDNNTKNAEWNECKEIAKQVLKEFSHEE
jgi:cell division septum initiation protein DivIVA